MEDQRSEGVCSTQFYERKHINQLRVTDFRHYAVGDKEYLVILFGLAAQRYEV